jgi:hypothetical protein
MSLVDRLGKGHICPLGKEFTFKYVTEIRYN